MPLIPERQRQAEGSARARHVGKVLALAGASALAVYAILVVNWYPIIAPDSLHYLDHSRDLTGYGFIQLGFRQVGYPLWLAAWSATARGLGLGPLAVIVIAQRLILAGAVIAVARVLHWWSLPTAIVVLLPTTVAYSNLVLAESIAIPIAVATAAACVALQQPLGRRARRMCLIWAGVGAIALPLIRLHYVLLSVAVVAAILMSPSDVDAASRRTRLTAATVVAASVIMLCGVLSIENHRDQGIFAPSLGSERVQLWMSWYTVLRGHEQTLHIEAPHVFLDGNPDTFILQTDAAPLPFSDKQAAYADAIDQVFEAADASEAVERVKSMVGVLRGSRIDDLGNALVYVSNPSAGLTPAVIHQYGSVAEIDPAWIAAEYNAGREPRAVLTIASHLPALRVPRLASVMTAIVPYLIALGIFLVAYPRSRRLAGVAVFVLMSYAFASFVYTFDNLKYLMPAYVFSLVMISGAAMEKWGTRSRVSAEAVRL